MVWYDPLRHSIVSSRSAPIRSSLIARHLPLIRLCRVKCLILSPQARYTIRLTVMMLR